MTNTLDLAGTWLIRPDHDNEGLRRRWFERPPTDGWLETSIPAAWQHTLGTDFHGVAWYRRRVEVPREWLDDRSRIWIRFESVATECRAWVNGVEIGGHVGDFLPFDFEIPCENVAAHGRKLDIILRVDEIHATRPPSGVTTENGHITKGFHDVLSLQHGGLWCGASLRRTGPLALFPDGLSAIGNPATGTVILRAELHPHEHAGELEVSDPDTRDTFLSHAIAPGQSCIEATFTHPHPAPWSLLRPHLTELQIAIRARTSSSASSNGELSDSATTRFGFRTVTYGGPDNRNILLNGEPICIRGVLHWGHEPRAIAPAPPPEQVRAEFARLQEMGFNTVCLCMVYMPKHYYDIADEMGMLLWQEHPIWKSRMDRELIPEYQHLCEGFFRRDRSHPSVVIVSASCEHERIHPDLAAWWWKRSKELLPDRLTQIQTAFIGWTNPEQTDLHDEHVYDSCGRWVSFLEDLQPVLDDLPPRPFVMGETIIGTSWTDVAAFSTFLDPVGMASHPPQPHASLPVPHAALPEITSSDVPRRAPDPPWWLPKGLPECRDFERQVVNRFGHPTLERFKRDAEHSNLFHRKFQSELLRSYPRHAGWVMNQIRDVPPARLGFMDELDRWRFSPEQVRPWLADRSILLHTPNHLRAFASPVALACRIGLCNATGQTYADDVRIHMAIDNAESREFSAHIACQPGDVSFSPLAIQLPPVRHPTRVRLEASAPNLIANTWDLWALPNIGDAPPDVVRLDGLPFEHPDHVPDFEERAYSSGWGLKATSWKPVLQHPEHVLFKAPLWRHDAPMPRGTRGVLAHKIFPRLIEWMISGGRVVLLANRSLPGLSTRFINLWAQCPLIVEHGPLRQGDSAWIRDTLPHDLTRRLTRAIPVETMPRHAGAPTAPTIIAPGAASHEPNADLVNIADQVDPIIRLVFTHDRGVPMVMDVLFTTRVGNGLLIASSLDHTQPAGQYLLHRLLAHAASDAPTCAAELDASLLRAWM